MAIEDLAQRFPEGVAIGGRVLRLLDARKTPDNERSRLAALGTIYIQEGRRGLEDVGSFVQEKTGRPKVLDAGISKSLSLEQRESMWRNWRAIIIGSSIHMLQDILLTRESDLEVLLSSYRMGVMGTLLTNRETPVTGLKMTQRLTDDDWLEMIAIFGNDHSCADFFNEKNSRRLPDNLRDVFTETILSPANREETTAFMRQHRKFATSLLNVSLSPRFD